MLRRIASALLILLASLAFIATPPPPTYPISTKEQKHIITLSAQLPKVERKIRLEIDPKYLSRSVENGLNGYDSVLSVGVYPEETPQEILEQVQKLSIKIYNTNGQEHPRENPTLREAQGGFLPLATSAFYQSCADHKPCKEDFVVVFEANNLTGELSFSWVALAQLGGSHPNQTPEKAQKASGALRILVE